MWNKFIKHQVQHLFYSKFYSTARRVRIQQTRQSKVYCGYENFSHFYFYFFQRVFRKHSRRKTIRSPFRAKDICKTLNN